MAFTLRPDVDLTTALPSIVQSQEDRHALALMLERALDRKNFHAAAALVLTIGENHAAHVATNAACNGNIFLLDAYLSIPGIDGNTPNIHGITILMAAGANRDFGMPSEEIQFAMVSQLVTVHKVNKLATDGHGKTAYDHATPRERSHRERVVKLLRAES